MVMNLDCWSKNWGRRKLIPIFFTEFKMAKISSSVS